MVSSPAAMSASSGVTISTGADGQQGCFLIVGGLFGGQGCQHGKGLVKLIPVTRVMCTSLVRALETDGRRACPRSLVTLLNRDPIVACTVKVEVLEQMIRMFLTGEVLHDVFTSWVLVVMRESYQHKVMEEAMTSRTAHAEYADGLLAHPSAGERVGKWTRRRPSAPCARRVERAAWPIPRRGAPCAGKRPPRASGAGTHHTLQRTALKRPAGARVPASHTSQSDEFFSARERIRSEATAAFLHRFVASLPQKRPTGKRHRPTLVFSLRKHAGGFAGSATKPRDFLFREFQWFIIEPNRYKMAAGSPKTRVDPPYGFFFPLPRACAGVRRSNGTRVYIHIGMAIF